MAAAMQDQQEETRREVLDRQAACKRAQYGYEQREARLLRGKSDLQMRSANALARLLAQKEEIRLKRQELEQANIDYNRAKDTCAATIAQHNERIGNLRQLRADVAAQVGTLASGDIRDCEVSPWIPSACSANC